jgi:biofilm PGA synthesis protein PgaD
MTPKVPDPLQFQVPVQDGHLLTAIAGEGMAAAANDALPLRDRPPIVDQKGLQTPAKRAGFFFTALLLFAFTMWCISRIATLVLWYMGLRSIELHFISLGGVEGALLALSGFIKGVATLSGALILWAFYNWIRFAGPDRRKTPPPITDEFLAEHYQLPFEALQHWQMQRRLIAHHDDRGVISGAESAEVSWIRPEEQYHFIIKPNTFDILWLSARSKMWRRKPQHTI